MTVAEKNVRETTTSPAQKQHWLEGLHLEPSMDTKPQIPNVAASASRSLAMTFSHL